MELDFNISSGGCTFYAIGVGLARLHGHTHRSSYLSQLDPQPEATDTSFSHFEHPANIQHRSSVLLRLAGPPFDHLTTSVPVMGWTASFLRNGHLHLRRHCACPTFTERHEKTAGFQRLHWTAQHWHVPCRQSLFQRWTVRLLEIRRTNSIKHYSQPASRGHVISSQ